LGYVGWEGKGRGLGEWGLGDWARIVRIGDGGNEKERKKEEILCIWFLVIGW
jgi:hypothetical protein